MGKTNEEIIKEMKAELKNRLKEHRRILFCLDIEPKMEKEIMSGPGANPYLPFEIVIQKARKEERWRYRNRFRRIATYFTKRLKDPLVKSATENWTEMVLREVNNELKDSRQTIKPGESLSCGCTFLEEDNGVYFWEFCDECMKNLKESKKKEGEK